MEEVRERERGRGRRDGSGEREGEVREGEGGRCTVSYKNQEGSNSAACV